VAVARHDLAVQLEEHGLAPDVAVLVLDEHKVGPALLRGVVARLHFPPKHQDTPISFSLRTIMVCLATCRWELQRE